MDFGDIANKGFYISTDNSKLNRDLIYEYLSKQSYWAIGRERSIFEKSLQHSLCFGVYDGNYGQAGFARVITDFAVYAYILDLFIFEKYRKQGLGKLLMHFITSHEDLQMVKKWTLATRDAHELYSKFGFAELKNPGRQMERTL